MQYREHYITFVGCINVTITVCRLWVGESNKQRHKCKQSNQMKVKLRNIGISENVKLGIKLVEFDPKYLLNRTFQVLCKQLL